MSLEFLSPFIVFPLQIFSFREIEKRGCTENPRLQLLLLQEVEPERAAERPGHHEPAVSISLNTAGLQMCRYVQILQPLGFNFQNPEKEAQQGQDVDTARGPVPEGFHFCSHQRVVSLQISQL